MKKRLFEFEDYGTKPVPEEKGKNWFDTAVIVLGNVLCLPAFMIGGMIGGMGNVYHGIIGIIIGALILTIISISSGIIGSHTKMSTSLSSKFTFGNKGGNLMAFIIMFTFFGWFGIQLEVFGSAFQEVIKIVFGNLIIPKWQLIIFGGVLMSSSAIFGYKSIERFSFFVVPVLLILVISTLVKFFSTNDISAVISASTNKPISIPVVISIVTGAMAAGSIVQADITRYSKNAKHTFFGMLIGMFIGFPSAIISGVFLGAATGETDFTKIMLSFNDPLWSFMAMLVIIFATWSINDSNLYTASLSLNALFINIPKWFLTVICGTLGTVFALFGTLSQFTTWLILLGVFITPIGAVMAADFFLFKKNLYSYHKLCLVKNFNFISIFSWIGGCAVGTMTFYNLFQFTTIPPLDSIIAAFAIHAILGLIFYNINKNKTPE